MYLFIESAGEKPTSILWRSGSFSSSFLWIDVYLDNVLPTEPELVVSTVILSIEPVNAVSGYVFIILPGVGLVPVSSCSPPYCLTSSIEEGIPKQLINALKPLSVPFAFKR